MAIEVCKLCGAAELEFNAHTARCQACGVLLYYPYPDETELHADPSQVGVGAGWYRDACYRNHTNFTRMFTYTVPEDARLRSEVKILDYGGGGGQFALICKSFLPTSTVFITDVFDGGLMDEYRPLNHQIRFRDFPADSSRFDFIFLNDVFEHLADPIAVLKLLKSKLKPGGKVFIDTPKQFWMYRLSRRLLPSVYRRLLNSVSRYHLQIWSRKSFENAVSGAGLRCEKYDELAELTMPLEYYLRVIKLDTGLLRGIAGVFYRHKNLLFTNKIVAVLTA